MLIKGPRTKDPELEHHLKVISSLKTPAEYQKIPLQGLEFKGLDLDRITQTCKLEISSFKKLVNLLVELVLQLLELGLPGCLRLHPKPKPQTLKH